MHWFTLTAVKGQAGARLLQVPHVAGWQGPSTQPRWLGLMGGRAVQPGLEPLLAWDAGLEGAG